jgi:hypothetical protein
LQAEILIDPEGMASRGSRMLQAMIDTAPIPVKVRTSYVGDCEILMTYGLGHLTRRPWQMKHVAKGGRMIGWDLGYWDREPGDGSFSMRATIDHDHPHRLIRPESPERWDAAGIGLREDAKERGPIILVGMGPKTNKALGFGPMAWEKRTARRIQETMPGRKVLLKTKRPRYGGIEGLRNTDGPIEEVIRGASLVVCRHSNVAVDACIAGVPVVCEDGAAFSLYRGTLASPETVTADQRLAFLRSLAWWQWKPMEAAQAWTYLLGRLCG